MKLKRSKKWWILPSLLVPLAIATPFIVTSCSENPTYYLTTPVSGIYFKLVGDTTSTLYTCDVIKVDEFGFNAKNIEPTGNLFPWMKFNYVFIPWTSIVYIGFN